MFETNFYPMMHDQKHWDITIAFPLTTPTSFTHSWTLSQRGLLQESSAWWTSTLSCREAGWLARPCRSSCTWDGICDSCVPGVMTFCSMYLEFSAKGVALLLFSSMSFLSCYHLAFSHGVECKLHGTIMTRVALARGQGLAGLLATHSVCAWIALRQLNSHAYMTFALWTSLSMMIQRHSWSSS